MKSLQTKILFKTSQYFYKSCLISYRNSSKYQGYGYRNYNHRYRQKIYLMYYKKYGKTILLRHIKKIKQILDDIKEKAYKKLF